MEIKGTVIQSLGLQGGVSKAGKEWKKAEILIETNENPQYPKKVKLSNMRDADKFAEIPVGLECVFHVEIESREFNNRWYTEVNCWKWSMPQEQQAPPPPQQPQSATPNLDSLGVKGYQPQQQQQFGAHNFAPNPNQPTDEDDPLPF